MPIYTGSNSSFNLEFLGYNPPIETGRVEKYLRGGYAVHMQFIIALAVGYDLDKNRGKAAVMDAEARITLWTNYRTPG